MSVPSYIETSQIVDQHLEKAIGELKDSVNRGFDEVNARLDRVVLRDTFDAELRRIDLKVEATDERLKGEVAKVGERVDRVGVTTKWAIASGLTGAGLLSGVVFGIVNALT